MRQYYKSGGIAKNVIQLNGLELKLELKPKWVVNIQQELCNLRLSTTKMLEVLTLGRKKLVTNYLNGRNKNGVRNQENHQARQGKDIFQTKP